MDHTTSTASSRSYYLDWLRVIAILGVFVFHSLRFFDPFFWHVKNATTYAFLLTFEDIFGMWGMPLMFVISGASTFYSLRRYGLLKFTRDRTLRLVVPLVASVFTLGALMVYLERVSHHQFYGSFIQWLPQYFQGWYGYGGNFAWTGLHLWYLEALFILSLLFLPLFSWFLHGSGRGLLSWLGKSLSIPGMIYLLGLPVVLLLIIIDPDGGVLSTHNFGGWSLPVYVFFFLNGFLLVSDKRLQESCRKQRWISLVAGLGLLGVLLSMISGRSVPVFGTARYSVFFSIYGLASWCLVLTILGFSMKHLVRPTPFLTYANEAVLPFYIFHQPVLLLIGFYVVRWPISDAVKWLVITPISFTIVLVIYEFGIRRINFVRFLFGMKSRVRYPAVQPA